jgi:flagellin
MSLFVQTNVSSLVAQENFSTAQTKLNKTMEQLSSGYKINSAADDAAGVGIASRLSAQVAAYSSASQNANNAISMTQTADDGASQISDILTRLSQLAVEGSDGTMSASDSKNLQQEFAAQVQEITNIASNTTFNGINLLSGVAGSAAGGTSTTFQVGITNNASNQVSVMFGGADAGTLGLSGVADVSTAADAQNAIATINTAIQTLSGIRAGFGAGMDALQDTVSNLSSMSTNTSAALSNVQDVDVASATASLAQEQVVSQAGEAILAQANQQPQLAVSLIHGQ